MDKHLKTTVITDGLPEKTASVLLRGQLTWPSVKQFQSELNRLLTSGYPHVILDLSELAYMDSQGLSAFIPVQKRFTDAGGSLKLVNPRRIIRHIFVSAKMDALLDIEPEKES